MTGTNSLIGVDDVAALLAISIPTVERLLEHGAIPSIVDPTGIRLVTRADAMKWRTQRDVQRAALADLSRLAQQSEGMEARRPPGVSGDLNSDDVDEVDETH